MGGVILRDVDGSWWKGKNRSGLSVSVNGLRARANLRTIDRTGTAL